MFESINWLASIVATLIAFMIGALWYSERLFAEPWRRALGLTMEDLRSGHVGRTFLTAFIAMFIAAVGFSLVLGEASGWKSGLHWGLIVGLVIVAPALALHNAFERKPLHY